MNPARPVRPHQMPKWVAVAALSAAAVAGCNCGPHDVHTGGGGGGTGGGTGGGGAGGGTGGGSSDPCGPGCAQYHYPDGGPVFYPDGGPYCLC